MATRTFKIKIEGRSFEVEVEEIGGIQTTVTAAPSVATKPIEKTVVAAPLAPATQPSMVSTAGGKPIIAPMPGKIISLKVSRGQQVNAGEVVLILEAMKMEQDIKTNFSGTVNEVLVNVGDTVKKEQVLIVIG